MGFLGIMTLDLICYFKFFEYAVYYIALVDNIGQQYMNLVTKLPVMYQLKSKNLYHCSNFVTICHIVHCIGQVVRSFTIYPSELGCAIFMAAILNN